MILQIIQSLGQLLVLEAGLVKVLADFAMLGLRIIEVFVHFAALALLLMKIPWIEGGLCDN